MLFSAAMLVALAIEALVGWPARLHARIGHPVTWLGRLVTALEARFNDAADPEDRQRRLGATTVVIVLLAAMLPAALIQAALPGGLGGQLVTGLLAFPLVAGRSLHDHVAAVARPLRAGDLAGARAAVAMIVGRDPAQLDEAGVARAATESLAENASDGIIAPLFWGALLGLPGIAGYKAINTMDSMIGHRSPRYLHFGRAAARLDDLVNLLPARATGLLFALAAGRRGFAPAWNCMLRDAGQHRSPNAGWPEAAMAGALGIRLSGPRSYAGRIAAEPYVNAAGRDPRPADLDAGLRLYRHGLWLAGLGLALLACWCTP